MYSKLLYQSYLKLSSSIFILRRKEYAYERVLDIFSKKIILICTYLLVL